MERQSNADSEPKVIIYETRRFLDDAPKYIEQQELEVLKAALAFRPDLGEVSDEFRPLRVIRWAGSPETNIFYALSETDTARKVILVAIAQAKPVPPVTREGRRRISGLLETLIKLGAGAVLKKIIDSLLE